MKIQVFKCTEETIVSSESRLSAVCEETDSKK